MSNQYPLGPQYPTHDMGDGLPPVVLPPGVAPPAQPRPMPVPMGPSAAGQAATGASDADQLSPETKARIDAMLKLNEQGGMTAGNGRLSQRALADLQNKFEDAKPGHQLTEQDLAHIREIIPLAARAHMAEQAGRGATFGATDAARANPTMAAMGSQSGASAAPMLAKLQAARVAPPAPSAPPVSMAQPIPPPSTDAGVADREAELNRRLQASKGAPPQ